VNTYFLRLDISMYSKTLTTLVLLAASVTMGVTACGPLAASSDDTGQTAKAVEGDNEANGKGDFCWKHTLTRGVGTIPDQCPGAERDGALCYPACAEGYSGIGPVCWQVCPEGYQDDGALCRGEGSVFAKHSYGRTAGKPMSCSPDLETDAGLCYSPCSEDYTGVGPVCWGECPANTPVDCGAACGASAGVCAVYITKMAQTSLLFALRIAKIAGAGGSFTGVEIPLTSEQRAALKVLLVEGMKNIGERLPDEAYENIADTLITALVTGADVDWKSLDPLGVSALVKAFNHPICQEPSALEHRP
jgi:hypothetical protein